MGASEAAHDTLIGVFLALVVSGGFSMLAATPILADITHETTGEFLGDKYQLFGGPYRDPKMIWRNLNKHRALYPQSHRVRNYKIAMALAMFFWATALAIFLGG